MNYPLIQIMSWGTVGITKLLLMLDRDHQFRGNLVLERATAGQKILNTDVSMGSLGLTLGLILAAMPQQVKAGESFVYTGSLSNARSYHTATLLPNGKVLVAGGFYPTAPVSSAELYAPSTGTWTVTGAMGTARGSHTAALLANGKVLVAGGYNGSSSISSAELYDPTTGTWTSTGSLSNGRHYHTVTLLPNGKVLVAGGSDVGSSLSSAELYDPATGKWTNTGSMSNARTYHTATLLQNGKVLVAGGATQNAISSAELYDPSTGTWTGTASLTTPRQSHAAILLANGQVLVAGGYNVGATYSSSELYNPATGTWTLTGSLSYARINYNVSLLPNGKVLASGGYRVTGGIDGFHYAAELYDPNTGIWTTTAPANSRRALHTTTLLPNGKVLVAGGNDGIGSTSSAELYEFQTGKPTSIEEGLIAYFPFNGNANDESGNGNNGQVTGARLTSDRFGNSNQAYEFNGNTDSISATVAGIPVGNAPRTLTAWVKPEDERHIQGLIYQGNGNCVGHMFAISRGSTFMGFWGGCRDTGGKLVFPVEKWSFVALIYDGTTLRLRVNESEDTFITGGLDTQISQLWIGAETVSQGSASHYFKGAIDEVRFYNRALSSDEITQLYELVRPKPVSLETGLTANYPFNGNTADISSNHNDFAGTAVFTKDRFSESQSAISFDGVSPLASPVVPLGTNGFAASLWLKLNKSPAGGGERVLMHGSWNANNGIFSFAVFGEGSAEINVISADGAAQRAVRTMPGSIEVGQWYHFAFWCDRDRLSLAINGVLSGSVATGLGLASRSAPLTLGGDSGYYFTSGIVDDLRVYNRTLTIDEVTALYQLDTPALKISSQPGDAEVKLGDAATFAVEAQGIGTLHYQWRFNGARIIGGTNSVLTITGVTALDEGDYTVEVIDDQGSVASQPARLILLRDLDGDGLSDNYEKGVTRYQLIQGSFTWREAKADAEARGGHLATITSEAEWQAITAILGRSFEGKGPWLGGTDEITEGSWRWVTGEKWEYTRWAGGEPNNSNDEDYVYFWDDGFWNDHPRLSVHTAYLLEYGYYTDPNNPDTDGDGVPDGVEVDGGSIPTDPTSKPLPKITAQPQPVQVPASQPATLIVAAIGYGTLSYQWFHDGSAISGATNPSFNIASVQGRDAGSYRVVISNIGGSVSSAPVALIVTPVLELQRLDNGFVIVQVRDQRALVWRIEASEDLATWTSLGTASYDAGLGALLDIQATGKPRRFYRAVAP